MSIWHNIAVTMAVLVSLVVFPALHGMVDSACAASVKSKARYYVTTTVSKSTLKKGKKAKVTVKVANTSGDTMKDLRVKVKLPAVLKAAGGTLTKSRASLGKKKSYSYSFYVKAKKKVKFYKSASTSKTAAKGQTRVVAKNLLKHKKARYYTTITMTFKKPTAATDPAAAEISDPADYAQSMVDLLSAMNTYAKKKNPKFAMVANGGYLLYHPQAKTRNSMLKAVDGALIEEAFTDSDWKDMQVALAQAASFGKKPFSIEYEPFTGDPSVITFDAVGNDELDQIPAYDNPQVYDVTTLAEVKNFMAILDPSKNYKTKAQFLQAIKETDYDLVFIDLYYDAAGQPFTKAEVNALKKKKNGGTRMVCSYLSVGEAENYRDYWQKAWGDVAARPPWIAGENPAWPGNFKVRYWYPAWRSILYGSPSAYLDKILAADFDGVYLDVIDAYEYFQEKK